MSLFTRRQKRFGEILVDKGFASKDQIDAALREQAALAASKGIDKNIGDILYEKGIIDVEQIEETLEEQKRANAFFLKSLTYWLFHSK